MRIGIDLTKNIDSPTGYAYLIGSYDHGKHLGYVNGELKLDTSFFVLGNKDRVIIAPHKIRTIHIEDKVNHIEKPINQFIKEASIRGIDVLGFSNFDIKTQITSGFRDYISSIRNSPNGRSLQELLDLQSKAEYLNQFLPIYISSFYENKSPKKLAGFENRLRAFADKEPKYDGFNELFLAYIIQALEIAVEKKEFEVAGMLKNKREELKIELNAPNLSRH